MKKCNCKPQEVFIGIYICKLCAHPMKIKNDHVHKAASYHDIFLDAPKIIRKGLA